ncbi:hypothetical protein I79_006224 [Cricetulus griseus]|uniref:Uncharacterized protein n=1 Tax=Cricetulus griseus TaxID=10029 RepID=G3H795_CRIGR|nr:hypothetical protein I79_006224 [Cricetulus griseus]
MWHELSSYSPTSLREGLPGAQQQRWDCRLARRLSVSLLERNIMAGSGMRLAPQMQAMIFLVQQHWHRRKDLTPKATWSRMRSSLEAEACVASCKPPHRCMFQVCADDNWLACSRMPRMRTLPRHCSLFLSVPEQSRALVSTRNQTSAKNS